MNLRKTIMLSLLCSLAAMPVRADEHEDEDEDEVRVEVIKARSGGGPEKGVRRERDDDDEERGGRGPHGGPMGGMKRMMISKERMSGREMDPAMKESHEKVRAAKIKLHDLGQKLRKAKDAEKPALKKEAKAAVGELFDARQSMEQAMVEKMTEHLAEKKAKLEKRKAAREKLIDEKVDQMAGDAPSWDD